MTPEPTTMSYQVTGRIARITLDRPHRGNGITLAMPAELAACVERARQDRFKAAVRARDDPFGD